MLAGVLVVAVIVVAAAGTFAADAADDDEEWSVSNSELSAEDIFAWAFAWISDFTVDWTFDWEFGWTFDWAQVRLRLRARAACAATFDENNVALVSGAGGTEASPRPSALGVMPLAAPAAAPETRARPGSSLTEMPESVVVEGWRWLSLEVVPVVVPAPPIPAL